MANFLSIKLNFIVGKKVDSNMLAFIKRLLGGGLRFIKREGVSNAPVTRCQ